MRTIAWFAAVLLLLAAGCGSPGRSSTLRGLDYLLGRHGFAQNDTEAVHWFELAAQEGDALGENNLGVMYMIGRGGLKKDDSEAVRLFKHAAE